MASLRCLTGLCLSSSRTGEFGALMSLIDNKQIIYAAVRDVTYAVYLPSDASVHAVDGLRLEVTLGADARYFSVAAVIDEYEAQQPANVPGSVGAVQNVDPVFAERLL